jgi:hypothetical protein
MEIIAPSLELLLEVRFGIEKGVGIKRVLDGYIQSQSHSDWSQKLGLWIKLQEMGRPTQTLLAELPFARRQVLEVLEQGLRGETIYSQLCSLQEELMQATELEIDEFVVKLPLKSLIPLLFLQFPAFLLLLIGPFLTEFLSHS